jgi:2-C-methyl-D-erythritol 4-phosphate cytidylyltransferase
VPSPDLSVWGIVVAAGSGSRFGTTKQYELIGGRSVLDRAVDATLHACGGVVAVVPASDVERLRRDDVLYVGGGSTRSASVRRGLDAVPAVADVIVVHDGVRPNAGPALFDAVVAAVRGGAEGAVCAIPLTDTIRRADGGTVDRSDLVAVQTPQAFRAEVLRRAYEGEGDATDDATLVEAVGGRVVVVAGAPDNIKITHAHDLAVAAALIGCPP